jgi:hypothetical protein
LCALLADGEAAPFETLTQQGKQGKRKRVALGAGSPPGGGEYSRRRRVAL